MVARGSAAIRPPAFTSSTSRMGDRGFFNGDFPDYVLEHAARIALIGKKEGGELVRVLGG